MELPGFVQGPRCQVNGETASATRLVDRTLLNLLQEDLGVTGTRGLRSMGLRRLQRPSRRQARGSHA